MSNQAVSTPEVIKKCPICGPGDGRCRQRGNLILCMTYVDSEVGDKRGDYVYSGKATGAGTWEAHFRFENARLRGSGALHCLSADRCFGQDH